MKESIAQSFIVSLILFFFVILLLLLFGSINYSKAFKAKNRIITVIEKYGSLTDPAKNEINNDLGEMGYQTILEQNKKNTKCNRYRGDGNLVFPKDESKDWTGNRRYDYCVFEYKSGNLGSYYQVVTFMKFQVPIIGDVIEFAVKGETKVLYENIKG